MLEVLSFLIRYSRTRALIAALIGTLAGGGGALLVILINQQLIGSDLSWGAAFSLFLVVLVAVTGLTVLSRALLIRLMQSNEYDLRLHLSRQILQSPLRRIEEIGTNRLYGALTQDIPNLNTALSSLPTLCVNAAMVAGCLLYLAWLSVTVLLGLLVVLAFIVLTNHLFDRKAGKMMLQSRHTFDGLMRHFRTLTEGIKELKIHAARTRAFVAEELEPTAASLKQRNTDAMQVYAVASTWSQMVFFAFVGLMVYLLPRLEAMGLAELTSFTVVLLFIRGPFVGLVDLMPNFRRASVAMRQLRQLGLSLAGLDVRREVVDTGTPISCRRITLEGVTHTYYRELEEDNFVLGPLDFTLNLGELVFLAGGNGSGKTTLAKVLCGLYPPESGQIRVDGKVVADHNLNDYRQLFSVVFSEFFLFQNLLGLDNPELDARAREYLQLLQLDHKVRVENGVLSTTDLSRGQRKRLALLTAYLEDRPFYIFDEWAADQDPYFKEIFYRKLLPDLRARGKGVLVISHDNLYYDVADRLVRLDYGRLEGDPELALAAARPAAAPAARRSAAPAPGPQGAPQPGPGPRPPRPRAKRPRLSLSGLAQDVRYAVRTALRAPGFAAVAILTLALGIGGNAAIFSFLNAVLLRPLPVHEPGRLSWVYAGADFGSFSYPDYADLRARSETFSSLAAFHHTFLSLGRGEETERIRAEVVSESYFSTLGLRPAQGRFFGADEAAAQSGAARAVLSHRLWQRRFGADPDLIGRTVELNGYPFTVIGIAGEDFSGTQVGYSTEIWVPLAAQPQALPALTRWDPLETRAYRWLKAIGRLAPGVRTPGAQAEMRTLAEQLARAHPDTNEGYERPLVVSARSGDPEVRRNQSPLLRLLMGAVGLVLLIACANVANLLLARALVRQGEIGVRQALGATPRRLVRQLVVEGLLLSLVAGALGLFLALQLSQVLPAFLPPTLGPVSLDLGLDARVLAFTLAVSLATGLIFGLAPALGVFRTSVVSALKGTTVSARAGGHRGASLRSTLVVAQVAISMVLLIGAGLLLRTLRQQQSADPGFSPEKVLMMSFDLALRGYGEETGTLFQRQVAEQLGRVPGVQAAHLAALPPLSPSPMRKSVAPEGWEPQSGKPPLNVLTNVVSPGHFSTLGVPLLRGRDFGNQDVSGSERVAIINEALANRLWPGESPIGKRIAFPAPPGAPRNMADPDVTVVGLARDSKYVSLWERPQPYMYLPLSQKYQPALVLLVRAEGDPAGLLASVHRRLRELDPYLPVYDVRTLTDQVGASLWAVRLSATLCTAFGLFALLLAAMGIYAVMAQSVAQRTHEIGVRLAVGAQHADVFRLVIRQSLRLTLIGLGIGLVGAVVLVQALSGFLFGVDPLDPLTFLSIAILLAMVAWAATYMPARRAVRVDPVIALRSE